MTDNTANNSWRPVGYWGLTLATVIGFPLMVVQGVIFPDANLAASAQVYPYVLAAWCGAAGIRQWGKNMGSEYSYRHTETTQSYGGDSWSG